MIAFIVLALILCFGWGFIAYYAGLTGPAFHVGLLGITVIIVVAGHLLGVLHL